VIVRRNVTGIPSFTFIVQVVPPKAKVECRLDLCRDFCQAPVVTKYHGGFIHAATNYHGGLIDVRHLDLAQIPPYCDIQGRQMPQIAEVDGESSGQLWIVREEKHSQIQNVADPTLSPGYLHTAQVLQKSAGTCSSKYYVHTSQLLIALLY
jgi:hypothetical protein